MKKRIIVIAVLLSIVLSVFAGGSKEEKSSSSYRIGICNYVDDASLNQIVENIKKGIGDIESKYGITIEVIEDNCNADANVLSQIISNFIAEKVDLMIGVATPVAMSMQAQTEDNAIPVLFAAVSDPVAAGIVDSLSSPGANITGTSDFLDTHAVMNLIFALNPSIKKVGLLYDAGQDSSVTALRSAREILKEKGIEIVEKSGTTVDEIILAADALIADGVEAVFTPSDNTVMTAELSIYEKFMAAGIPHFTGADSFALNGAFLGYGVDYASLGYETAMMIEDILIDGKKPSEVAVKTFDNGTATVNREVLAAFGYTEEQISSLFSPYCTRVAFIDTAESF